MKQLEIEKIKAFIEAHGDHLAYQIFGEGGYAHQVTCEISLNRYPKLTVSHVDIQTGKRTTLFLAWENMFKKPTQKQLSRFLDRNPRGFDMTIMHHWNIIKLDNGEEMFVLSCLSASDYIEATDLYKMLSDKHQSKAAALISNLQADLSEGKATPDEICNRLEIIKQNL